MVKQKMRVGVKAAWIVAGGAVLVPIIGGIFSYFKNEIPSQQKGKESQVQKVEKQTADSSGSINNYNAERDVKIENVSYNNVVLKDLPTVKEKQKIQSPVIAYKDLPLQKKENPKDVSKNQIINNAPNHGIQINEVKGNLILNGKPSLPERKISIDLVKQMLSKNINKLPIGIQIFGTETETNSTANQIESILNNMGYKNINHEFKVFAQRNIITDKGVLAAPSLDTKESDEVFWIIVDKNQ